MCHFCGAPSTMSNGCNEKQENVDLIKLHDSDYTLACKFCGEKQEKESAKQVDLSPYASALISPTPSLPSSDSTVSSFSKFSSDFSVDVNSFGSRCYQDEVNPNYGGESLNNRPNGHIQQMSLPLPSQVNGIYLSDRLGKDSFQEGSLVSNRFASPRDAAVMENGLSEEAKDNHLDSTIISNEEMETSCSSMDEMDNQVWIPPEAEDPEDDMEGSVVNYDDEDDECGDGSEWGKPSSLSSFGDKGSGSYRFREEKQKAMNEVMNGKFKALVGQLLRSVGVSSSEEDGDSWVDIVTSLSWEAASFVKPDAIKGKAMDPDGYVKIKCVATGTRGQSEVIRGLVFKKHAAHKHMPTKYKNPRLLLIQGSLGLSSSGLSSFDSMKLEKDNLKSIIEMIEMCHPNVVLVEKTVSRDIQESILEKRMTLVFDMKLHRLERVARCTGSEILSADVLAGQKLKHCDSFHIEKFVEEHAGPGEAGKRPSKTLMFIEGCPTRLGCTILLKGSHSDELKRIKCVVQCAVVMAYHLILETSFLLDQRAMFSTIPCNGMPSISPDYQLSLSVLSDNSKFSPHEESSVGSDISCTIDTPISNGFHEEGPNNLNIALGENPTFSYEPYNPVILSGLSSLSASLKRVIGDNFPLFSSASHQSTFTSSGINERDANNQGPAALHVSTSPEALDHGDLEMKASSDDDKASDHERSNSPFGNRETPSYSLKLGVNSEDQIQSKDGISSVLDCESILVLMSSRNASRGTICEQSHLSHIKFYRNFDVPLGRFLEENLLNQRLQCATCGESPEAHFYYYAHHNKQLTFQVKCLPGGRHLPGHAEGKLWMWSRCGKCKSHSGNPKSTKRVLISTAARGLSFGKFLELSFSNQSTFSRPSSCGHSLHRDFIYFFGLGPMVAMLRYSQVATYSTSLPPQKLEFTNSIKEDLLNKEFENVYNKGMHLFQEVARFLQHIASQFSGSNLKHVGTLKEFSDVEELLNQERIQFEVNIQNAVMKSGNQEEALYKLLSLNRVLCDLLLESCVWDQRLHSLLSDSEVMNIGSADKAIGGQNFLEDTAAAREINSVVDYFGSSNESSEYLDTKINQEASVHSKEFPTQDIPVEGTVERNESSASSVVALAIEGLGASDDNRPKHNPDHGDLEVDETTQGAIDVGGDVDGLNGCQRCSSGFSWVPTSENFNQWVWTSFPEIQREYLKSLQRGYMPKFDSVCSYNAESFPTALALITEEGSRLHIPLGSDEYIVSDYEDELSSIIACALALLKDIPVSTEVFNEEAKRDKLAMAKIYESAHSLTRISSLTSPPWSTFGSVESDGSPSALSSEESRLSSFDGLNLLDSLVSVKALHPEVAMGFGKLPEKGKYSVLCLYANNFRDIRNRCCPSELDYIASLSRCRNWDAKGGKSKSFFAKTLDDRFIIKEIKKTEFESFVKFAPDYFRYMNECFEQGNQTCLAKILGIYQVTIRQTKSGKELKHDLMVMENLSFGRNITRQYDLKGALHARFNSAADGSGDVLLDQNFVNDMNASPLYVGTKSKRLLQRAVWNDTSFLYSINVMDYSLLVGVDTQHHELVCGIIDYLRQYTWDKQLETWVKSSLVVPKNLLPTVISPREYKKRFRKFITTYFLSVPDHWCSQRSSNPCKLCGMGEDDPSSWIKYQQHGEQNGCST
ncbi:1-phosphatidylinositol-3-phosphate 5-kinase [Bertholletia excelsa]